MSMTGWIDVHFKGEESALAKVGDVVAGIKQAVADGEPYPEEYAFLYDSSLAFNGTDIVEHWKFVDEALQWVAAEGINTPPVYESEYNAVIQVLETVCEQIPEIEVSGSASEDYLSSGDSYYYTLKSAAGSAELEMVEEK